jgi:hypothetical protein
VVSASLDRSDDTQPAAASAAAAAKAGARLQSLAAKTRINQDSGHRPGPLPAETLGKGKARASFDNACHSCESLPVIPSEAKPLFVILSEAKNPVRFCCPKPSGFFASLRMTGNGDPVG